MFCYFFYYLLTYLKGLMTSNIYAHFIDVSGVTNYEYIFLSLVLRQELFRNYLLFLFLSNQGASGEINSRVYILFSFL